MPKAPLALCRLISRSIACLTRPSRSGSTPEVLERGEAVGVEERQRAADRLLRAAVGIAVSACNSAGASSAPNGEAETAIEPVPGMKPASRSPDTVAAAAAGQRRDRAAIDVGRARGRRRGRSFCVRSTFGPERRRPKEAVPTPAAAIATVGLPALMRVEPQGLMQGGGLGHDPGPPRSRSSV